MRRLAWVLGALAMASPGLTAAVQQPAQLTAAVGGNMNHVPSLVGVEKWIFLKHSVDLKLKVLSTRQEMTKALEAGDVQIIGVAYSNDPVAVERGMAAKGVVGMMGDRTKAHSDEPISVWTRNGTGVGRIEDLAGRRVGMAIGGAGEEYLTLLLRKKGVPSDKVTFLNVPPGNTVAALQDGSVDAVSVWDPFGAKVPDAVLIAQYTRLHPDEGAEIATRWVPGLAEAVAKEALRHMTFDPRLTRHTIGAWEETVRTPVEQKKLRSTLPWQQGIELKFIERVMKSHPQLFTDLEPVP